jgi:anti-anti-sigma regulatory factor
MKKSTNAPRGSRKRKAVEPRRKPYGAGRTVRCVLPATLDMRGARELKATLDAFVANDRLLLLDASSVLKVSTGCIQILVSFVAARSAAARPTTVWRPTTAVADAVRLLGLSNTAFSLSVEA